MIFDTFTHRNRYAGLNENVDQALEIIGAMTTDSFEAVPLKINGEQLFINRCAYESHDTSEAVMEAHGRYIDVMAVLEGEETVYVYPAERLQNVYQPYKEADDVLLASFETAAVPVRLTPGTFLILFPEDAHSPGCMTETRCAVKKIIGKALIVEK